MTKSWVIPILKIDPPTNPNALTDLVPLLARLVAAFDPTQIAELLDVNKEMLEPWLTRRQQISYDIANRVMALHEVMTRALQIHKARTAMDWLVGNDPFLNYARPIDVLVLRGSAPLIEALEAFDSGALCLTSALARLRPHRAAGVVRHGKIRPRRRRDRHQAYR